MRMIQSLSSIANYSHNIYAGLTRNFTEMVKLKETGQYINGLKEGEWIEYDETGKATTKTKYRNGVAK
jgi:antitoxin component YwqK of YwqJK toxin-antitoxin module